MVKWTITTRNLMEKMSLKSIKCDNINLNVNGLELNVTSFPFLNGLASDEVEAYEAERSAGSYGSYGVGYSGSDRDFRSVCINNNNNTVVEAPPPPVEDECPEAEDIESCFRQFLLDFLFPNFVDALESEAWITVEINGQEVTLRSFEDISEALEGHTRFAQLQSALVDILAAAGITDILITPFAACIAEVLGIPVSHG
jgi:hypothetical protein